MKHFNIIGAILVFGAFIYIAYMQYYGNQKAIEISNWPQVEAQVVSATVVEASKPRSIHTYYKNKYIFKYRYKDQNFSNSCRNSYNVVEDIWNTAQEAAGVQLKVNSIVPIFQSPDGTHCIYTVKNYSDSDALKYSIYLIIIGFVLALLISRKRKT